LYKRFKSAFTGFNFLLILITSMALSHKIWISFFRRCGFL